MPKGVQLVSGRIRNPGQSGARVLALNSYVITIPIFACGACKDSKKLSDLTSVTELKVAMLEA